MKKDGDYNLNQEFQKEVSQKTKGIIKSWSIKSNSKDEDGLFNVELTVSVSKYKKSKQAK